MDLIRCLSLHKMRLNPPIDDDYMSQAPRDVKKTAYIRCGVHDEECGVKIAIDRYALPIRCHLQIQHGNPGNGTRVCNNRQTGEGKGHL
jgi:hypothetical protein